MILERHENCSLYFMLKHVFFLLLLFFVASCSSRQEKALNDKASKAAQTGRIQQLPAQDLTANPGVAWPAGMRRLAVLPIYSQRPIDDTQRDMDGIFRAELSKVVKYEIVQVSRADMLAAINREAVGSAEIIPAAVISMLKNKYGADAVLFTDFTVFRPYRPLAIGVRTKIVDVRSLNVLWMADGIVDSAEPEVSQAATDFSDSGLQMRYISSTIKKGRERENGSGNQIILQSPRLYAAFVAHEAFASLAPPVPVPQPTR